jgi:hypothetical protein
VDTYCIPVAFGSESALEEVEIGEGVEEGEIEE